MKDAAFCLLSVRRLPARLKAEEVAVLLNCHKHDVPALIAAKLLKPLARPAPNSIKFFATSDVDELLQDGAKLARVTQVIYDHWQGKNARKKTKAAECDLPGLVEAHASARSVGVPPAGVPATSRCS